MKPLVRFFASKSNRSLARLMSRAAGNTAMVQLAQREQLETCEYPIMITYL